MALEDVKALEAVMKALEGLDASVKERVLRWAAESIGVAAPKSAPPGKRAPAEMGRVATSGQALAEFATVAEAVSASGAKSQPERALVVAAYLSTAGGKTDFSGQDVNAELKQLGHGVGSINKVMDALKNQKPQLVVQTKKTGAAKQGRRQYRVTTAGFKQVESMLNADAAGDE